MAKFRAIAQVCWNGSFVLRLRQVELTSWNGERKASCRTPTAPLTEGSRNIQLTGAGLCCSCVLSFFSKDATTTHHLRTSQSHHHAPPANDTTTIWHHSTFKAWGEQSTFQDPWAQERNHMHIVLPLSLVEWAVHLPSLFHIFTGGM